MKPIQLKGIQTDREHRAALEVIEAHLDAQPGTPEADAVEVLAVLVEEYERRRFPMEAMLTRRPAQGRIQDVELLGPLKERRDVPGEPLSARVSLRLPRWLRAVLVRQAQEGGLSLNGEIVVLLRAAVGNENARE